MLNRKCEWGDFFCDFIYFDYKDIYFGVLCYWIECY